MYGLLALGFVLLAVSCGGESNAPTDAGPFDAHPALDATEPDAGFACPSTCQDLEVCDGFNTGVDDDCDGTVDEDCPCAVGTIVPCFRGDPSMRGAAGCEDGSMLCGADSRWGACEGGRHASDDCAASTDCEAINALPFVTTDLSAGPGSFADDAISAQYTVACPSGVAPCPPAFGANFQAIQSGEYTVTYEKETATGAQSCTFPLYIGATGLRIELSWEYDFQERGGSSTVDLDLHVHKPGDTSPWAGSGGNAVDCSYNNCTAGAQSSVLTTGVDWFGADSWLLDSVFERNACYFAPRGVGAEWQSLNMGCHSPRLDIDNISCDPAVTDPQSTSVCLPENINLDVVQNDAWTRVGVHYYSDQDQEYDVHPRIKIFCNGQLAGDLGATYGSQANEPVTFTPQMSSTGYWLVADVLFPSTADVCPVPECIVQPLFLDQAARTPYLTDVATVSTTFAPDYPPVP